VAEVDRNPQRPAERHIKVSVNRYVVWRVGIAIVVAVGSLLFAFLWDPTECSGPAIGCPPQHPDCAPISCAHLYVPLRVGVALTGIAVTLALLWSARTERHIAAGEAAS
jgi:hypothetical protein